MPKDLGVAVIGAGMAGKAHAAAFRTASALYNPVLPPIRLVSIGDVNPEFGSLAARRFGYERNDTSWQAIAEAEKLEGRRAARLDTERTNALTTGQPEEPVSEPERAVLPDQEPNPAG